jgi:hypothetical protein
MKKLLLLTVLIFFSGFALSQTLQKGNLLGVHVMNIDLKPDVTINQMHKFMTEKLSPAYEKNFGGHVYLIKCVRGKDKYSYGMIYIFDSEKERNKMWNEEGGVIGLTELGKSAYEKMQPVLDEFRKEIGEFESDYNDWVVQ